MWRIIIKIYIILITEQVCSEWVNLLFWKLIIVLNFSSVFLLLSVGTLHSTHKTLQSTTTQVNNTSKLLVEYKKYRMFEKSVRPEEMRHKRHCIVHYIVHTFIHFTAHFRVHCRVTNTLHYKLYCALSSTLYFRLHCTHYTVLLR